MIKKMVTHWIVKNFQPKITKQGWLKEIEQWTNIQMQKNKIWDDNGKIKKAKLSEVKKYPNTYVGKWFNSNQTWTDLYYLPEYLYLLWSDFYSASRRTYPYVGVYEKGNTVVDVGGSIFGAYTLLKYGAKKVLVTNFDNSPQINFVKFIAKKFNLPIKVISHNKIPKKSILVCSEYFEHFKDVDKEIKRILKFKPERMYIKNTFCYPAYGHYIPIKINGKKIDNLRLANKNFKELLTSQGFSFTSMHRFLGTIEKYEREVKK